MIGKPSGYIESLPKALRNRLAYLGELQDQHDDLAEKHHEEQVALQRKYEKLWGEHSQEPPFTNCGFCSHCECCSVIFPFACHATGDSTCCQLSRSF